MDKLTILQQAKAKIDAIAKANREREEDEASDNEALNLTTMITGFQGIIDALDKVGADQKDIIEAVKGIIIKAPEVNVTVPKIETPQIPKIEFPKYPDFPEIPTPEVTVNVPEIKIPKIIVPKPEVTVNVPKIKIPEIKMPKMMDIMGDVGLRDVSLEHPLPVQLRNADGSPMKIVGGSSLMGGGSKNVHIKSPLGQSDQAHGITVSPATDHYDEHTRALNTIEHEHHEIHAGSHFNICGYQSFTNAQVVDFTVVTPNTTKWTHMTFGVNGAGATRVEIYEGATVNVAGTPVTAYNNDRNSTKTTSLTVRVGDTFTATGTLIYGNQVGANKEAGLVARDREMILKQNTTYIFRITNATTLANLISWCAEWYEHTNKHNI